MATCHGVGVKNRRGKSLRMLSTCDNTQMLQISKLHRLFGGIDPIIGDLGWMPSNFYRYDATVLDDNGGLDHIHRREAGTEALVVSQTSTSLCGPIASRLPFWSPRFQLILMKDYIVNQLVSTNDQHPKYQRLHWALAVLVPRTPSTMLFHLRQESESNCSQDVHDM